MTRRRLSVAWVAICVLTAFVYIFLLAPIAVVLIEAFNADAIMRFPPERYSSRWFIEFWNHRDFMASLWASLEIGVAAAVISTVLGAMAALALARSAPDRAFVQTVLMSPLYVPRVLICLALLLVFAWFNVIGSWWGMVLGHVLITLPFTIRSILVGLRSIDNSIHEAAHMLGAGGWKTFHLVTMPLIRYAIVSGFTFAFIISFSDIYLALFISGPETITLPMQIFTFMQWDHSPLVAAAAAIQMLLVILVVWIAGRLFGFSTTGREL